MSGNPPTFFKTDFRLNTGHENTQRAQFRDYPLDVFKCVGVVSLSGKWWRWDNLLSWATTPRDKESRGSWLFWCHLLKTRQAFKLSLKFITNTFRNETAFCFYVLCSFCYVLTSWVFSTSLLGQQSGSETSKCKTDLFFVLLNLRVSHVRYPLFTCLFYTACGEAVFWQSLRSELRWTGTFCFILDTTKPIK